ncbi:MAG: histone deacetylase 11 [Planctomycetota bacterium]|jgi:histone deacetylase 11
MNPAFVYTPDYDFALPTLPAGEEASNIKHFDGNRASRAWKLLCERDPLAESALLVPEEISDEDLALVHDADYLMRLRSPEVLAAIYQMPALANLPFEALDSLILRPQRFGAGGTLFAMRAAFERGLAVNLSGGYHHAKRASGHGYCIFSDIAVAAEMARRDHDAQRVMVVDLDAHQGNGVSSIMTGNIGVAIFDMYNKDIYPDDSDARAGLRWDLPISSGCSSASYLELLQAELPRALDDFQPQLVFYNAGTDIVRGDPLGMLQVDSQAVHARDTFVLTQISQRQVPTVVTASGGYSDLSYRLLGELLCTARELGSA